MGCVQTLYRLQTERLDPNKCRAFFENELAQWNHAREYCDARKRESIYEYVLKEHDHETAVNLQRWFMRQAIPNKINLALNYIHDARARLSGVDQTFTDYSQYPELQKLSNEFLSEEISSYPTTEEDARFVEKWADEQGLLYRTDVLTIDGENYYRILSTPVFKTQTSIAGVVFHRQEVIDIPYRKIPSVAKFIARVDDFVIFQPM